jgi:hypothetical protein
MFTKRTCQALLVMSLAAISIAWGVQRPQWITNERDLKAALKTAKTPDDHMRIAGYCEAKADRLDAAAADYERAAAATRNGPVVKNLTAPNTAARYEQIAKEYHEAAQAKRQLAAAQEKIANDALQALQ